ncbi:hypothetical protein HKBW3S43_01024 [Candidatus Hakubella thermalkaliphila]|uniref:Uncharacterized protein n=1 Tax=Candidatus Hakubella thermalkaliphila TaxID=2754717 RepID=A0A6V8PRG5_9ACTN|nr:hypothetical protein HKBW3S43_01024 [Candidatus Hakubella thermalkaliphila]
MENVFGVISWRIVGRSRLNYFDSFLLQASQAFLGLRLEKLAGF